MLNNLVGCFRVIQGNMSENIIYLPFGSPGEAQF